MFRVDTVAQNLEKPEVALRVQAGVCWVLRACAMFSRLVF